MDDLIVNFTPTGMLPTREQTPYAPLQPDEIIRDVKEAWGLGITMVHLHVRDKDDQPHYDKELYRRIIAGIREFAPELIICASTSGRVCQNPEQRAQVLDLEGPYKPDMASLTLSSLNFNTTASLNDPDTIHFLATRMRERGILAELEAFDAGMLNYAKYLTKKDLLAPPHYVNLLFGNIACAQANVLSAGCLLAELPEHSLCSIAGIGDMQLRMNSLAISMGYGVRVGLEDNIWYDSARTRLASNTMLLERVFDIARANGRKIMRPEDLRRRLGLAEGRGSYGLRRPA